MKVLKYAKETDQKILLVALDELVKTKRETAYNRAVGHLECLLWTGKIGQKKYREFIDEMIEFRFGPDQEGGAL